MEKHFYTFGERRLIHENQNRDVQEPQMIEQPSPVIDSSDPVSAKILQLKGETDLIKGRIQKWEQEYEAMKGRTESFQKFAKMREALTKKQEKLDEILTERGRNKSLAAEMINSGIEDIYHLIEGYDTLVSAREAKGGNPLNFEETSSTEEGFGRRWSFLVGNSYCQPSFLFQMSGEYTEPACAWDKKGANDNNEYWLTSNGQYVAYLRMTQNPEGGIRYELTMRNDQKGTMRIVVPGGYSKMLHTENPNDFGGKPKSSLTVKHEDIQEAVKDKPSEGAGLDADLEADGVRNLVDRFTNELRDAKNRQQFILTNQDRVADIYTKINAGKNGPLAEKYAEIEDAFSHNKDYYVKLESKDTAVTSFLKEASELRDAENKLNKKPDVVRGKIKSMEAQAVELDDKAMDRKKLEWARTDRGMDLTSEQKQEREKLEPKQKDADLLLDAAHEFEKIIDPKYVPYEIERAESTVTVRTGALEETRREARFPERIEAAAKAQKEALQQRIDVFEKVLSKDGMPDKAEQTYPGKTETYAQLLERYKKEISGVQPTQVEKLDEVNLNLRYENLITRMAAKLPVRPEDIEGLIKELKDRAKVLDPSAEERVAGERVQRETGKALTEDQNRARIGLKEGQLAAEKLLNRAWELENIRDPDYVTIKVKNAEAEVKKAREALETAKTDLIRDEKVAPFKAKLEEALRNRLAAMDEYVKDSFKGSFAYPATGKTYQETVDGYRRELAGVAPTEIGQLRDENLNEKYDNIIQNFATPLPIDAAKVQKMIDALGERAKNLDPKAVARIQAEDEGRALSAEQERDKKNRNAGQIEAEDYLAKKLKLEHMNDPNYVPAEIKQADARVEAARQAFEAVGTRGDTTLAQARTLFDAFKKASEDRVSELGKFAKTNVTKAELPKFKDMIKESQSFAAWFVGKDNMAGLWSYMRSLNSGKVLAGAERKSVINDHYTFLENQLKQMIEKAKADRKESRVAELQKLLEEAQMETRLNASGKVLVKEGVVFKAWNERDWNEDAALNNLNDIRRRAGLNQIEADWRIKD